MKKIILSIILVILLIAGLFVLTGCGNKENENNATYQAEESTQTDGNAKKVSEDTNIFHSTDSVFDYELGNLCTIREDLVPVAPEFKIKGIILVGNRHSDYSIESLLNDGGYKLYDINSSFYLNEQIEFYLDTDYSGSNSDINILVTPHDIMENYQQLDLSDIKKIAEEKGFVLDYKTPEKNNYNYIGNGYVSLDYPEGMYDILFFYKGKLAYYLCIDLKTEPTE